MKKRTWNMKREEPSKVSLNSILDEENERMKKKSIKVDSAWKQETQKQKPEFQILQMMEDDEALALRLYQEELESMGLATSWKDEEFSASSNFQETNRRSSQTKNKRGKGGNKRRKEFADEAFSVPESKNSKDQAAQNNSKSGKKKSQKRNGRSRKRQEEKGGVEEASQLNSNRGANGNVQKDSTKKRRKRKQKKNGKEKSQQDERTVQGDQNDKVPRGNVKRKKKNWKQKQSSNENSKKDGEDDVRSKFQGSQRGRGRRNRRKKMINEAHNHDRI